jgi:hypothetical protein
VSDQLQSVRDRRFESALGRVLGAGILASTVCLAAGLPLALSGTAVAVARLLLGAGLFLLMATPIARVVVSIVTYARRRDWLFAVLTLIVLLELGASVVAAFASRVR